VLDLAQEDLADDPSDGPPASSSSGFLGPSLLSEFHVLPFCGLDNEVNFGVRSERLQHSDLGNGSRQWMLVAYRLDNRKGLMRLPVGQRRETGSAARGRETCCLTPDAYPILVAGRTSR
jgi:hypothetical protein